MSDEPNKSKVINLDSDVDDDSEGPLSPNGSNVAVEISSPYGKARVYTPIKNTITAHIWQVCPPVTDPTKSTLDQPIPLPLTGMCCLVRGTPSSEFQFFKGQHESDLQMIADSHVIDQKFDYALKGVVQKSQGGLGKWPQRCLLWVEEPTNTPFTKEQWIQVYIHWISMCIKKGHMNPKNKPSFDPLTGFNVVTAWSDVINPGQMDTLFQKSFLSQKHCLVKPRVHLQYSSIKTYFRYSKNNLYSFFNTGHVDFHVVEQYGLRNFLLPVDLAAYDAAKAGHTDTDTALTTEEEVAVIQNTSYNHCNANTGNLVDIPRQLKRKSRN
jgi:hypothetical protein